MTEADLSKIVPGKKEILRSYVDHFTQVVIEVEGDEEGLKCWIFKNGLLKDHPFRLNLGRKKVKVTQEKLRIVDSYMILEGKLNML